MGAHGAHGAPLDDGALRAGALRLLWRAAAGTAAAAAGALALCALFFPLLLAAPLVYVIGELVFLVLYVQKYQLLSSSDVGRQRPLDYCPTEFFEKATEHLKQFEDVRSFLSLWFHGAPFEALRRGNVSELLAYAFFYRKVQEVEADGQGPELEAMVDRLQAVWRLELPPGYNPDLKFMGHLWEPLSHMWRPLGFYLAMEACAAAKDAALAAAGFQRRTHRGVTYFVHPGGGAVPAPHAPGVGGGGAGGGAAFGDGGGDGGGAPILLLHGVGMGLFPYVCFMAHLAATGRPVIAVEFKHIAMRWVNWLPTVDETAQVTDAILCREGVDAALVVAHSYGTAVASRLLQGRPERVAHLCLIDPVCFHMFMPTLLRSFLYEAPRTGSAAADFAMASAARELHVSASMSRRFLWTDVNLWENQVPDGTLVVLSGRDVLMETHAVRRWLEWHTRAVVMTHPTLAHAEFLVAPSWQRRIILRLLPLQDAALAAAGPPSARRGGGGAPFGAHRAACGAPGDGGGCDCCGDGGGGASAFGRQGQASPAGARARAQRAASAGSLCGGGLGGGCGCGAPARRGRELRALYPVHAPPPGDVRLPSSGAGSRALGAASSGGSSLSLSSGGGGGGGGTCDGSQTPSSGDGLLA